MLVQLATDLVVFLTTVAEAYAKLLGQPSLVDVLTIQPAIQVEVECTILSLDHFNYGRLA